MTIFRFDTRTLSAVVDGLPTLSGSEKQVAWAETIRLDLFRAQVARRLENLRNAALRKGTSADVVAANTADTIARCNSTIAPLFESETSAKFWIENRNGNLSILAAKA